MDQDNLNNKTLDQLQKEKIQAEINILNARLEKEFSDDKPPGFLDKLANIAGKWSSFVLGTVALISAVFGVFVPLSNYLVEQRKALEYDLNGNMINFVDDLNSEDPSVARRSIMMLSYYETNSIPILLFFLEDSRNNQQEFREKIIETIGLIYSDSNGNKIVEMILSRLQSNFYRIMDVDGSSVNPKKLRAMYNFMDLIKGIEFRDADKDEVLTVYQLMKAKICGDESLKNDFDMIGIHSELCQFLNVEDKCE